MSNASQPGQPIDAATAKAIDFKIGHEFNELRNTIARYIAAESSAANSTGLALHRGYQHIKAELVPEMLDRVVTYCLDVGIRDANAISLKVTVAFETQLKALGQSLGVSYQTRSAGGTMQAITEFKGWVSAYCVGIPSRVHVAVQRRLHMDPPPEPPKKNEPVGAIYNITGPTQINTGSPGSSQTNSGVSVSRAAPLPPAKKTTVWKYINRLGIVATIAAGAVGTFEFVSHRATARPPSVVSPAIASIASPPPVPAVQVPKPAPAPASPPEPPKATTRKHGAGSTMKNPNDPPKPGLTINGPAQLNNNSPGSIQNNFIGRAPPRDLSHPGSRQGLLDRVPEGEKFRIERVSDAESGNFAKQVKDFLVANGRVFDTEIIAFDATWMGVVIYAKQQVKEGRGADYYLVRIGADDGRRSP